MDSDGKSDDRLETRCQCLGSPPVVPGHHGSTARHPWTPRCAVRYFEGFLTWKTLQASTMKRCWWSCRCRISGAAVEAAAREQHGRPLPRNQVSLTFHDSTQSVFACAPETLKAIAVTEALAMGSCMWACMEGTGRVVTACWRMGGSLLF